MPGSTDRDRGYWRDVGTIDVLLRRAHGPRLDPPGLQPLQLRVADLHRLRPLAAGQVRARLAAAASARPLNSSVSPGVVVSGAHVDDSVLSPRVEVAPLRRASATRVLLDGVEVGRHAVDPPGDHRQERRRSPRAPGSASTTRTTGPAASTSPRPASSSSARARSSRPDPTGADSRDVSRCRHADPRRAHRRPAPAAARRLRARSATRVRRGRGARRRRRLQLGPLLPAERRPGRQALRVLDDARRLGRGRPSGSRSARW